MEAIGQILFNAYRTTFYALVAQTEHLTFLMCAVSKIQVLAYILLLEDLYDLEMIDDFKQEKGYRVFEANAQEIRKLFQVSTIAIVKNKLEKSVYINHELGKIFEGQTKAPFLYVDGLPEHLGRHYEMVGKLSPSYADNRTDI